ncbi:response regulator transcription factor [Arsenicicoccus sp. oral taxon 190]|uniref:response regulator transcription factor n=1 Tax=Arsenicicoccus sp. oral taxon 190 TaxID=1658671 RepID=UPI000679EC08|nr:response regulator transcription factor [Arsenicicoccus sp. oral taxon 190]AKT52054.1 hypothetical protein ADJ73_13605 [Arsenicicoccus sp. oral taxon 190]
MSASHTASTSDPGAPRGLRVLLYSDDSTTRDKVRLAVGRRPARDVSIEAWHEVATGEMALRDAENGSFDLLILDGEAAKVGGMGLARQMKNEIYDCPPILVLTGRPQDSWLAAWSQADLAVPQPLDPLALATGVCELVRRQRQHAPA